MGRLKATPTSAEYVDRHLPLLLRNTQKQDLSATKSSVDNKYSVRAAALAASEKAGTLPQSPATTGRQAAPSSKRPDPNPLEEVLRLLARAIRQFHTYPADSP